MVGQAEGKARFYRLTGETRIHLTCENDKLMAAVSWLFEIKDLEHPGGGFCERD